ncbi:membrane lipoprotein lipid attachment site-containing protein [Gemella cuniculi]|uniref:membrane lipoprotein lipid attachment site-containing protein n=1 Tax=Gemella cuniculi TaxID=150240 RepID=UPI0003FE53F2|nr:membrane lipoprotein lipid attachment site-containing protein [Gemella cuniculi]
MKRLIVLITALFILQGCSNKGTFSQDQLQNLTNSVSINQLEKTEFNPEKNRLLIYSTEELISKEDFDKILKTLKLNNFSGKEVLSDNISSKEFDNKNFDIEVVSKNKNTVSFNTNDVNNKNYNIVQTKYSSSYVKEKISTFSKDLITFDELAGTIETDLNKSRNLGDKVAKFNEIKEKINTEIASLKTLTKENTEYENITELTSKVTRVETFTNLVISAVNNSINSNSGTFIARGFLNINEIDRIARELEKM